MTRKKTPAELPPASTIRWTPARKKAVVAAIKCGTITVAEAVQRYRLSRAELDEWIVRARNGRLAATVYPHSSTGADL